MALFGGSQWGVPVWGGGQNPLIAGGGNAGSIGAKYPSQIPGLTFTTLKTPEFKTLVQSSPDKYELRLPQVQNPVWHFQLVYDYIYGATPSQNNKLAFPPYTDIASFMGFFNGNYGQYGEFLYDDPKDRTASGVLFGIWQPNRAYNVNDVVIDPISGHAQSVSTAGTSAATIPNWAINNPLVTGDTTLDGTVLWDDEGYFPDGFPNAPVTLPLWNDGKGNYFSPIQRNCAGQFLEDITDLNGSISVWANGVVQPPSAYAVQGLGLALPGNSCRGVYLAWAAPPTPPVSAAFNFYFRVRLESDQQDFERTMDELWTIGGGRAKNGSGYLKLMSARSVGAIVSLPGSSGTFVDLPVISSFTATPSSITSGGSATLAWTSTGGSSATLNGSAVALNGSQSVSPTAGTTYRLVVSNAAGDANASATVTVSGGSSPPTIASFSASPPSISPGQTTTLAWSVSGFVSLLLNPGAVDVTLLASLDVTPGSTTDYVLTATSSAGGTATADAFVSVGGAGTLRTLGKEPGIQFAATTFGSPANSLSNISQYGEYSRSLNRPSPYNPRGVGPPSFYKAILCRILTSVQTGPDPNNPGDTANSYDYVPYSTVVPAYAITRGGVLVREISSNVAVGLNLADPAFLNYWFETFLTGVALPMGPNAKNGIPTDAAHPTIFHLDGWSGNFNFFGATPWDSPFPQTAAAWHAAISGMFQYAAQHHPEVRLLPHGYGEQDPSLATFQATYGGYCPGFYKESFPISSGWANSATYYQLQHFFWLANQAPPVFPGEPRIIDFGTVVDNGDIHTALALYCLCRGPNTFFAPVTGSTTQDPNSWLPVANYIGVGTSAPNPVVGAAPSAVVQRNFAHGVAFVNFSGSTQNLTSFLPSGSMNWNRQSISSLSLAHAKGEVVLLP